MPILFSTPMVKAILEGRKTMTRRVIKKKYSNTDIVWKEDKYGKRLIERQNDVPGPVKNEDGTTTHHLVSIRDLKCPYGKIGDILWVRETFINDADFGEPPIYVYKADCKNYPMSSGSHWMPSIFMPKEACRLFLKITSIRIERLHDISEEDSKKEGVLMHQGGKRYLNYTDEKAKITQAIYNCHTAKESFKTLWTLINGFRDEPFAWFKNPFVWVVSFERVEKPTE